MAGTHGYLAAEFAYQNELTTKSDVYSFGVLLLELISGRKLAQAGECIEWQSIFEWDTPLIQSHRYTELLDPSLLTFPMQDKFKKWLTLFTHVHNMFLL